MTLRFNEGVDAGKSSFQLIGPDGEVGTGKPTKDGGKVMTLDDLVLGPGEYTIKWTVGSEDGHLVRGKLSFTVLEPTPPPATLSPAPRPATDPVPPRRRPPRHLPRRRRRAASTAPPSRLRRRRPNRARRPHRLPAPTSSSRSSSGLLLVAGIGVVVIRRSRGA